MSKSSDRQQTDDNWRNRPRVSDARRKDQRFAFRLNAATADKLREMADRHDLTVSEMVVQAIEEHLARLEKKRPRKKS